MAANIEHPDDVKTPPEQVLYADILFWGCWTGLALMIVTYFVYLTGILPPHVPLDQITTLWTQKVAVYLEKGAVPIGWGWTSLLNKGDFLNFLGIALLAGLTMVCYVPLIPAFFKKKDPVFAIIALTEVVVLFLAASGIVAGGHH
ncbi:hypothetical protein JCM15519_18300 [Fundidesulfovibrio butyratiphilus]